MSNGIDLMCDNKDCPNVGTKMTLHGRWPIAKIDDILSSRFPLDDEFKAALLKRKKDGRTHACVPLPNEHDIATEGLRVQMYCSHCVTVWDEDFLESDYESKEKLQEAVDAALNDPPRCRCGADRLTAATLGESGVSCPACGVKTKKIIWCVKPVLVRN